MGCASNPFADPFEFRVRRLAKKVAARVRDEGLDEKTFILAGYGVRNRPGRLLEEARDAYRRRLEPGGLELRGLGGIESNVDKAGSGRAPTGGRRRA